MNVEQRFAHLQALAAEAETLDFGSRIAAPRSEATLRWLGRLFALVENDGDVTEIVSLRSAADSLGGVLHDRNVAQIRNILHRAIATAELQLPTSARGAYVPVGNTFDAMSALQDIFATVQNTILIVDAYMDARVVRDFAPLAPAGVKIALLTDESGAKADLVPVCRAWVAQWGGERPLEVRLTKPRKLHDRLVLGNEGDAWILTQSLKDFATRSPASIQKSDRVIAEAKYEAYSAIWEDATDPMI